MFYSFYGNGMHTLSNHFEQDSSALEHGEKKNLDTKTALSSTLSTEKPKDEELMRIYGLNDHFVPWSDKEFEALQNKPENLMALSEYFQKNDFFDESISLRYVSSLPRGFKFPKVVNGGLNLPNLSMVASEVKFPEKVHGLYLENLKTIPEDLELPHSAKEWHLGIEACSPRLVFPEDLEELDLPNLREFPEGVKFPDQVRNLHLNSLTKIPESVKIPDTVKNLDANFFSLPEGFVLPKHMYNLDLTNLQTIPKGMVFPEIIEHGCFLDEIKEIPEGTKFPAKVGILRLTSLRKMPHAIKLPEEIDSLNISNLERREYEGSLPKLNGLTLPDHTEFPRITNHFYKQGTKIYKR